MPGSLFDLSLHPSFGLRTPDDMARAGVLAAARALDPTGDAPAPDVPKILPATAFQEWNERVTPQWNWRWPHLALLQATLDRVRRRELARVIIQMPPRHGKSETGTVRYPVFRLEETPWLRVIVGAYNQTLANKFSRKARRLARGRVPLSEDRKAVEDWETTEGGGMRAVGVGGGVTGQGGDLILIDDPVKSRQEAESDAYREHVWEWYTDDLYTRLEPGGAIVLTMTRWHEDDLAGRILASEDGPNWTVISLPALAEDDDALGRPLGAALCPDRYNEADLARIRVAVGERGFASLYQQRPAPATGAIIQTDHFRFYTTRAHPIANRDGTMVPFLPDVLQGELQSWDMTFKGAGDVDFVAGHAWGWSGADAYLLDRERARADFIETIAMVRRLTERRPKAVAKLVEDKANGPAIIATLRHEVQGLIPVEPEGDKVARAWAVTPLIEAGNVWLPHPAIAPWVKGFLLECARFPYGKQDDDVDAMTQALRRIQQTAAARNLGHLKLGAPLGSTPGMQRRF